jgi:hypothetical protein
MVDTLIFLTILRIVRPPSQKSGWSFEKEAFLFTFKIFFSILEQFLIDIYRLIFFNFTKAIKIPDKKNFIILITLILLKNFEKIFCPKK